MILPVATCSVAILARQFLMWHAIGTTLSLSKRDNEIECCTTLAAIAKQSQDKILRDVLGKIIDRKKKWRVRISRG